MANDRDNPLAKDIAEIGIEQFYVYLEEQVKCKNKDEVNMRLNHYMSLYETVTHGYNQLRTYKTKQGQKDEPQVQPQETNVPSPDKQEEKMTCVVVQLTSSNIIQEAIKFHEVTNLTTTDLTETIQEMLGSEKYILCETFLTSKLDYADVNTFFLSAIAPQKLKKDDLRKLLFIGVVCEDLI
jgi:hypothetical protein